MKITIPILTVLLILLTVLLVKSSRIKEIQIDPKGNYSISYANKSTSEVSVTVDGKTKIIQTRNWVNKAFYICVGVLYIGARATGMSYEEINVWVFCVLGPIVFFAMVAWIIYLLIRIRRYKQCMILSFGDSWRQHMRYHS